MKTQYQLPAGMVPIIRGEVDCSEDLRTMVEVGRLFYQDGKDGNPYTVADTPANVSPTAAELVNRFLSACWELGCDDSGIIPF